MTTLAAAHLVTPDGVLSPGVIEFAEGEIRAVSATTGLVPDRVLAPGLIDLQVNGIDEVDVATAAGSDWDRLDELLLAQGVTAWCPTLVTTALANYAGPLGRIAAAASRIGSRPTILGAHLEGPFLGGLAGAHPVAQIRPIDLSWLATLPEVVRLITLGAEVSHVSEAISFLTNRGITVGLGHSAADLDQFERSVEAGAVLVTHGFNAMSPLGHRAPGMVGGFLTDDRVAVSLIADLVHVHPTALEVAFRCKPPAKVILVTDSVAWRSGRVGDIVTQTESGAPRLADGTLAGSMLRLDRAVANVVQHCGVSLGAAVAAASTNPAALLGLEDRGSLEVGRRADITCLDPATLTCTGTWVGGEQVHG